MNPEERNLLERSLKLSEENHRMLRSMQRKMRWTFVWGIIKLAIIVLPFIIAYLYLEPHFGPISETLRQAQEVLEVLR